jgi:condensin complex subunit 1
MEPWTKKFYEQLKDTDVGVRKNTLMVLTHLILNDMIKVKGQIR